MQKADPEKKSDSVEFPEHVHEAVNQLFEDLNLAPMQLRLTDNREQNSAIDLFDTKKVRASAKKKSTGGKKSDISASQKPAKKTDS